MKQTLINDGFPDYIGDEQTKRVIKNISPKNKHCNTSTYKQAFI